MQFRNHDVITYTPHSTWCHHGIAVVYVSEEATYFKDTYWGIGDKGGSGWIWDFPQNPKLIGNLDDFEHNPYKEYDDYKEEDKFYIPTGGSSTQQWFRKGAEPDPTLVYNRLYYELEKADNAISSAQRHRDYQRKLLTEHVNKYGIPVQLMDRRKYEGPATESFYRGRRTCDPDRY